MPTCDRCGEKRHRSEPDRFRSGRFTETAPDGTTAVYNTLCEDCHRDVVRS